MTLAKANELYLAFSDPTRLRVLNLLSAGELCVCQLVYVLGMSQPKISRHLAVLREVGLVNDRKDGRWVYYSLAAPATMLHKQLMASVETCRADAEILADDLQRLKRAPRNLGQEAVCCA